MRALLLLSIITISTVAGCIGQADSPAPDRDNSVKQLVLVAGATGNTGEEVVKHLLAQDYPVRVLVRNQEKAEKMFGDSVEIRVADITDAPAVMSATSGAKHVISALGSGAPSGPNSPEFIDYGGVKNLVEASVAADVDQFVLVSSIGATKIDHELNRIFGNVLIWKLKGEDALRDSGMAYTIVRPGELRDEAGRQKALFFDQGDKITEGYVSRDDLAEICVAALSSSDARGKTFEVIIRDGEAARDWSALFAQLSGE